MVGTARKKENSARHAGQFLLHTTDDRSRTAANARYHGQHCQTPIRMARVKKCLSSSMVCSKHVVDEDQNDTACQHTDGKP